VARAAEGHRRDDLIGDARYETGEARWQRKDEVDALMEAWTSKRPSTRS
jgi:crotonobetainyl-CoA:carnitine CoA-transferase CaiB-like acyl-CoA transferase